MRRLWLPARHIVIAMLVVGAFTALALPASPAGRKQTIPNVRWDEQTPGCTFSRTDDGKLQYGLSSGDVGITLSVDSQELEKVHRRHQPFFGILLRVRYRGRSNLDVSADEATLEFASHFKVVQASLDPDTFAQKIQDDADAVDHSTAREIEKHPEARSAREGYMRAFQRDTAELLEFVSKRSLREVRLDPQNQEVNGWVLFGVNNKWIGKWKKREELILRVPLEGRMFEFPFTLPPKPSELELRRRD
jgi:hypothetical protein